MKKSILVSMAVVAASLSMSAQTEGAKPANSGYFGIRASGTLTCPSSWKSWNNYYDNDVETEFKKGGGLSIGMIYHAPITRSFYVEPGVSLYYNATGIKHPWNSDYTSSMRESGMLFPVMLGFQFDATNDVNMQVFYGPELRVGFSNEIYETYKGRVNSESEHESQYRHNASYRMNRVNCDLRFGVGFNISRKYYVGISGVVGLSNAAYEKCDNSFHQNHVDFTIGYNFR